MRPLSVPPLLLLCSSLLLAPTLRAQAAAGVAHPEPVPQVVTSATGEVRVTPDRATIFMGVQTRGKTAAEASVQNARKVRAVLDTLRAAGIPQELISTVEYNVYPEQRYDRDKGDEAPIIIGYNVSNTVRIEVRNLADLGKLIDAALAKGANNMNSLQFFSSKADSARRVALGKAVELARKDGEAMARAAGVSLGDLLELSSSQSFSPPIPMMAMARAEAVQTPVSPGEQVISAAIVARWRLNSGPMR
jgi:uncharacterized protein YggE